MVLDLHMWPCFCILGVDLNEPGFYLVFYRGSSWPPSRHCRYAVQSRKMEFILATLVDEEQEDCLRWT